MEIINSYWRDLEKRNAILMQSSEKKNGAHHSKSIMNTFKIN